MIEFTKIDDSPIGTEAPKVSVSSAGTVRVNGRSYFDRMKDLRKRCDDESEYVDILISENLMNPKGIKIKDPELQEKLEKAGLLS